MSDLGIKFHCEHPSSPPNAHQRHRDGLAGPVHFCAAFKRRSAKPVQWYTLPPRFIEDEPGEITRQEIIDAVAFTLFDEVARSHGQASQAFGPTGSRSHDPGA